MLDAQWGGVLRAPYEHVGPRPSDEVWVLSQRYHARRGRGCFRVSLPLAWWDGRVGEKNDAYQCWMMDAYLVVGIVIKVHGGRVLIVVQGGVVAAKPTRGLFASTHSEEQGRLISNEGQPDSEEW